MAARGQDLRRRWRLGLSLGLAALVVLPVVAAQGANAHASYRAVCPGPPQGSARCHALVATDAHGNPDASSAPSGLSPAQIRSAYGFPTSDTAGAGKTIAIVDAYDDPTAESDLAVFSSEYGLPACTTANGCFTKVNQSGGTSYPKADAGWALEISLDVQWAHAVAPGARILLVEASSSSFSNLLAAEDYAKAHAQYVSNSWGASEFSGESLYDSHFRQSGVSFFVSAGDSGLPAEYPSASPNVISVGGTTLSFDGAGNLVAETGWSGGGGGCSVYEAAPSAQAAFAGYAQAGCGDRRATPDVALDADPASGVSVYDSTSYYGQRGWFTVGGTSASSPMWAARSADEGAVVDGAYVYGSSIGFRDITAGNNGAPCLTGYDLCSGRGSWVSSGSSTPAASLAFPSPPQTLTAGLPSTPITVSLSSAQSGDVAVSLASSSAKGLFSTDGGASWTATSVTVPAGSTSASFLYEDTSAGSPTISATASGLTGATQTETVVAGPLATVGVTPGSATVTVGGTQTFTVTGQDAYGNPITTGLSATWSTGGGVGTLSTTSGPSTTFTGTTAGSGTVTAAVSPAAPASASVTVKPCRGKRCK